MKSPNRLLITAGFALCAAWNVHASDVRIIANQSVKADSISLGELRSVYLLQRKTLKDGSRVMPVLEKSGAAHEIFLRQYLKRDSEEARIYYQGLVFTGKGSMPKELNSDEEVLAYVAVTKGAVGYVSAATRTDGVKTLEVIEEKQTAERALLVRVDPEYPETLRKLNIFIAGTVRLELTISPQGKVENVFLLAGNPALGEAAIRAARQWSYAPGPAQTTVRVTVTFDSPK